MGAVAYVNFGVVRFFVSSADQVAQGGNPYSLLEDMAPQVEQWSQGAYASQFEPLLRLVKRDEKNFPSRLEWAEALRQTGRNLSDVVSGVERRLLESAQDQLATVIERPRTSSNSGVFARIGNTNGSLEDGGDERHLRDAILVSIGGSVLTANNTLSALEMTIEAAKRQPREVQDEKIGDRTIGDFWSGIEEQSRSTIELVRELKKRIDSMRLVAANESCDLKDLLLSGGHLERIFSRLAKLRLLLGQFQKRVSSTVRGSHFQEACWRLYHHAGNCVDLTKLTASLFRGLIEIQRLYQEPQEGPSVNLHAYLRASVLQAVLGKDVHLRMDLASEPWDVFGPSKAVWQAVINLAAHARESVKDFGDVEIATRKLQLTAEGADELSHHYLTVDPAAGDYMVLTMRDSGPGIQSVMLPRVFDLHEHGYGMAFMRRVVEDMGGFIGVDSETGGDRHGTTFSIYFPRSA